MTIAQNKEIFKQFLNSNACGLSAFSFVSLFAWQDFFDFEIRIIDDCLCVFASDEAGCFLYLPPLGKNAGLKVIKQCFAHMKQRHPRSNAAHVENVPLSMLPLFDTEIYQSYRRGYEYLYWKKGLEDFKGNAYKSRRSDYNYFLKNHPYSLEEFAPAMVEECLALYREWAEDKKKSSSDDIYQWMLKESEQVHERILKNAAQLPCSGLVVKIKDEIAGYTLGYPLNKEVFCVLFEITRPGVKGLPAFIFRSFCSGKSLKPYSFINAMDDFETPGAARAKLSFRPVLLPVYSVKEKES